LIGEASGFGGKSIQFGFQFWRNMQVHEVSVGVTRTGCQAGHNGSGLESKVPARHLVWSLLGGYLIAVYLNNE
jgi:hypothetical protein